MKKEKIKLYNVIFPLWMLWLFPQTWFAILPANFLVDLLVVVLTMRYLGIPDVKSNAKKVILRTWLCGFAADFVGTLMMFAVNLADIPGNTPFGEWWYDELVGPLCSNPFESVWAFLWTAVCVLAAAGIIYLLNWKFCLKRADMEEIQKKKLALSLAVFTAPYLFYLPTKWFYW